MLVIGFVIFGDIVCVITVVVGCLMIGDKVCVISKCLVI